MGTREEFQNVRGAIRWAVSAPACGNGWRSGSAARHRDARGHQFAHQNIVIAGGEAMVDGAFDLGQRVRQQRHAGGAGMPGQAVEAVVPLAREAVRDLALLSVSMLIPK